MRIYVQKNACMMETRESGKSYMIKLTDKNKIYILSN